MDRVKKIKFFQDQLLKWFETNGREFHWRKNSASNYVRIISEVLLQRTKAETVNKYLPSFINKYSSWADLGNATEQELIGVLGPLGLSNQRGRRLYNLAQELRKRNGVFPKDRLQVEEIPMMGQYLTNAFELFIMKNPSPLLDINMSRVLERFFGPRKLVDIRYDPYLQELSRAVVDHKMKNEINWAILDFASLVCTPRKPSCVRCPLNPECLFYLTPN